MFGNSVPREQYDEMKARAERAEAKLDKAEERIAKLTDTIVSLRRRHMMDPTTPAKASYVPPIHGRSDAEIVRDSDRQFIEKMVAELVEKGHSRADATTEAIRMRKLAIGAVEPGEM